jgi:hypothetical protein
MVAANGASDTALFQRPGAIRFSTYSIGAIHAMVARQKATTAKHAIPTRAKVRLWGNAGFAYSSEAGRQEEEMECFKTFR